MPEKIPPLLLITLVLVAGCMTPVPKDKPAEILATGSVEVLSTPPGAEVYLDTVYRGTTPVTVIDLAGSHTLELRLRDHQSWSKSIQIYEGTKSYVDTLLVPVPVITSLQTTVPTTRSTTVPTTRPRPVTTPTTIRPAPPQTPTPWPRTFLGCFQWESYGRTGTGESVNFTDTLWFQPAGVGLLNHTWIFTPPKKTEVDFAGFTWSRDPAMDLITLTAAGGNRTMAEVTYNGNNDTITYSNVNMRPTIFGRVPC
ncbi:MAG: PEGA domain-containing protein [Methanoregula sp.]|nr:PEGA domain-containing protein [Methanoregula sp.]